LVSAPLLLDPQNQRSAVSVGSEVCDLLRKANR
jgi:hypothetical protein